MNIIEDAPKPIEGYSPWIAYDGSGCPVDENTRVMFKTGGETWTDIYVWYDTVPYATCALNVDWACKGFGYEEEIKIVAFSFLLADEEH